MGWIRQATPTPIPISHLTNLLHSLSKNLEATGVFFLFHQARFDEFHEIELKSPDLPVCDEPSSIFTALQYILQCCRHVSIFHRLLMRITCITLIFPFLHNFLLFFLQCPPPPQGTVAKIVGTSSPLLMKADQ